MDLYSVLVYVLVHIVSCYCLLSKSTLTQCLLTNGISCKRVILSLKQTLKQSLFKIKSKLFVTFLFNLAVTFFIFVADKRPKLTKHSNIYQLLDRRNSNSGEPQGKVEKWTCYSATCSIVTKWFEEGDCDMYIFKQTMPAFLGPHSTIQIVEVEVPFHFGIN